MGSILFPLMLAPFKMSGQTLPFKYWFTDTDTNRHVLFDLIFHVPVNTMYLMKEKRKLDRAVNGAPSQIPTLKFLTPPSTTKSHPGA